MPTLTLSDLSARVLARLDGNSNLYPQAEITSALNEATQVLNAFTGFLQTSQTISSVANQTFYSLTTGSGNMLLPLRVQFDGTYLEMLNINEIGQRFSTWLADTTASTGLPVSYWVPFGFSSFAIYPADAIGSNTISVVGIQDPVLLVSSGNTITVSNEIAEGIDNLAFNILTLKETGSILQGSFAAFKAFQKQVQRVKIWQGKSWPSGNVPFAVQPESRQAGRP